MKTVKRKATPLEMCCSKTKCPVVQEVGTLQVGEALEVHFDPWENFSVEVGHLRTRLKTAFHNMKRNGYHTKLYPSENMLVVVREKPRTGDWREEPRVLP